MSPGGGKSAHPARRGARKSASTRGEKVGLASRALRLDFCRPAIFCNKVGLSHLLPSESLSERCPTNFPSLEVNFGSRKQM